MFRNLLKVFVLLILASIGSGLKYDGLRVKFGTSGDRAGIENFFSLPRTVKDAVFQGWYLTERPKGRLMSELIMYCYPGRTVCTLYADTGFVAGLQIAFPVEAVDPAAKLERYFTKWSPPATEDEPHRDFWAATQYYVIKESLKAGAPTAENGNTLQAGGVWIDDLDGNLMKIPLAEEEIKPPFTKQICYFNMGVHYFYNVSREFDCSKIFMPWYAITVEGELVGVSFQANGKRSALAQNQRKWFEEIPPGRKIFTIPDASECILDNNEKYGTLSIHIYFIDKPWEITCDPLHPKAILRQQ